MGTVAPYPHSMLAKIVLPLLAITVTAIPHAPYRYVSILQPQHTHDAAPQYAPYNPVYRFKEYAKASAPKYSYSVLGKSIPQAHRTKPTSVSSTEQNVPHAVVATPAKPAAEAADADDYSVQALYHPEVQSPIAVHYVTDHKGVVHHAADHLGAVHHAADHLGTVHHAADHLGTVHHAADHHVVVPVQHVQAVKPSYQLHNGHHHHEVVRKAQQVLLNHHLAVSSGGHKSLVKTHHGVSEYRSDCVNYLGYVVPCSG